MSTQEQNTPTLTDERLISDFMGYEFVTERAPGKRSLVRRDKVTAGARFNECWDWLMPVVEKIESLGYDVTITSSMVKPPLYECQVSTTTDIICDHGSFQSKMNAVYMCVKIFINWYNSESKHP